MEFRPHEYYSNAVPVGAIVQAVGSVGSAAASQKKSVSRTQAEAMCGKRPHGFLGIKTRAKKEQIANWDKCVRDIAERKLDIKDDQLEIQRQQVALAMQKLVQKRKEAEDRKNRAQRIVLWGGVGFAVLATLTLTTVVIYKNIKKN